MEKEIHLRSLKNECDVSLDKVIVLNTFEIYAHSVHLSLDIIESRS